MATKVCVIFTDGFEDMELVVPVDVFRRSGISTKLLSASGKKTVASAHGLNVEADGLLPEVMPGEFDALVLPGGPSSFKDNPFVVDFVRSFWKLNRLICAICAAPIILNKAGVLDGKRFCCHPCVYDVLTAADREARVVVDENLITAKGPGVAAEFSLEIVNYLCGKQAAEAVKSEMFL